MRGCMYINSEITADIRRVFLSKENPDFGSKVSSSSSERHLKLKINMKLFVLLVVLSLVACNCAELESGTDIERTPLFQEDIEKGCIPEGKWCPKKAPCCGRLDCKGPSPKQKKCTRV